MTGNAERRGPLNVRVTGSAAGIRILGLGEHTLDPDEARKLATDLTDAAGGVDGGGWGLPATFIPGPGCAAHLEATRTGAWCCVPRMRPGKDAG